ncbi:MAG: hypothetical protein ACI9ZV_000558, partial [Candidatus Azotimanducaceae bacterium]
MPHLVRCLISHALPFNDTLGLRFTIAQYFGRVCLAKHEGLPDPTDDARLFFFDFFFRFIDRAFPRRAEARRSRVHYTNRFLVEMQRADFNAPRLL